MTALGIQWLPKKLKKSFFNRKLISLTAISNVLKDQSSNFKAEQGNQLKQRTQEKWQKNKQKYEGNMLGRLKRNLVDGGKSPKILTNSSSLATKDLWFMVLCLSLSSSLPFFFYRKRICRGKQKVMPGI